MPTLLSTFRAAQRAIALRRVNDNQLQRLKVGGVNKAVPAQEERLRGANPASELALAGAIDVRASDDLSCDWLTFGLANPHPQRVALYTSCLNCQRFFVTNSTNLRNRPFL